MSKPSNRKTPRHTKDLPLVKTSCAIDLLNEQQYLKLQAIDRLQHEWAAMQQLKIALIAMEQAENAKR